MQYRTTSEWERYLGAQIRNLRLRKNFTQEELSNRADVSVPTLNRLETGKGSSMASFIKVLHALGEVDHLESLAPKVQISPIQLAEQGRPRQRAGKKRP